MFLLAFLAYHCTGRPNIERMIMKHTNKLMTGSCCYQSSPILPVMGSYKGI